MSDAPARAMPKSVTFTWPSSSMITLCGLMSRCTIPRPWAKRAPCRIWIDEVGRARRVERAVLAHDLLERAARGGTPSRCSRCRPTRRDRRADDVGMLEPAAPRPRAGSARRTRVLGEAPVQQLQRHARPSSLSAPGRRRPCRPTRSCRGLVAAVDERVARDPLHYCPSASRTRLAIGAARPAGAALEALERDGHGHVGREADEPRLVQAGVVELAVPVLPATSTPSSAAAVPVPSRTTCFIIAVSCGAVSREITRPARSGSTARPCGRRDRRPWPSGAASSACRRWRWWRDLRHLQRGREQIALADRDASDVYAPRGHRHEPAALAHARGRHLLVGVVTGGSA